MGRHEKQRWLSVNQQRLVVEHLGMIKHHISWLLYHRRIEVQEVDNITGFLEYRLCTAATLYDPKRGSFATLVKFAFKTGDKEYYLARNNYRERFVQCGIPWGLESKSIRTFDLSCLMRLLIDNEKKVLREYLDGLNFTEISSKIDCSKECVRLIFKKVIVRLQEYVRNRGLVMEDFVRN